MSTWYRGHLVPSFVTVIVLAAATASGAAPVPQAIAEGTVSSVDASSVTVAMRAGGTMRAAVTADTRIIRRQMVRLDQIKPREFVGVAAKRETDGSLTAVTINIFPVEWKGQVREGQFPMTTGNLMTNALVFQNVRRIDGRTLYLQFPEGTTVINVPRDAEINRLAQVRLADVKMGMRVIVRGPGSGDGAMSAVTITIDETIR